MAIRPRSIGELLDGAVRLYKQDIGLYMFTAIVAALPMAVLMILSLTGGDSTTAAVGVLVLFLPAVIATVSVWTALMIQMNDRLEGREPGLGSSVGRAVALVFRVVWAVILAYIVVFGAMLVGVFGVALVGALLGMVLPPVVTAIVTGLVALAVLLFFGVPVLAGMMLFLPGIVVEGLTGYQAIKRGWALAKGGHFRIVSVVFISWVLIFVPITAVYFVTGTTGMLLDPNALQSGVVSIGQVVVQQLLTLLASGVTTPFMVACILLLYFDQRVRREAYDLQAEAEALAG